VLSLCNENQLDELFILSLFRQSASTCLGHICSPSSGGVVYIYNTLVRVVILSCLSAGQVGTELHGQQNIEFDCG
jgi:hypothetical protein